MRKKTGDTIQAVDLIRSLAILTVLASHLSPTLPPPSPALAWIWDHFQWNSEGGVFMFFVVSGFLITRVIDRGPGGLFHCGWKWFYARRIGRIAPLFFTQILLGIFLIFFILIVLGDSSIRFNYCFKLPKEPLDPAFWFSLLTLVSYNWVSAYLNEGWQWVGHHWALFWSLSIEEQFYLFYPLILTWLGTRKNLVIFLTVIALGGFFGLSAAALGGIRQDLAPIKMFLASYGEIALGVLLYLTFQRYRSFLVKRRVWSWALTITGLFFLLSSYGEFFQGDHWIYRNPLMGVGVFLFLAGGMTLPLLESKWLKVLTLPGKYSYGNYLLHIAVLYFIIPVLRPLNVLEAFFLFAFCTTVIAAFSFHYFEVPANHWVRRQFGLKGKGG